MEILAIVCGILALVIWVISFQIRDKKKILLVQIVANLFYAIQYSIYGAFSAVGMNTFSIIRNGVYYRNEKKQLSNPKRELIIFLALITLFGIITIDGLLSIIPIIITLMYTFGTWVKNTTYLRCIYLVAAILWIYYNCSLGVIVPLIGNILELVSGLIAIIRLDILKKGSNKNEISEVK